VYTAYFRARGEIYIASLNIHLHLISHEEFRAYFLDFAAFYTDCYGQPGLPPKYTLQCHDTPWQCLQDGGSWEGWGNKAVCYLN